MVDFEFVMRYPFSSKAKEILQTTTVQLNERAIALGSDRVKKALAGELGRSTAMHKEEQLEEIISYAAARLILGHMRNRFITNKFAVAEAKRASQYLNQENDAMLLELETQLKISTVESDNGYTLPITQYVKFAPPATHYKLTNRILQRGRVFVNRHERLRILEEAIRIHVNKIKPVFNPPEAVKLASELLTGLLPKIEKQPIDIKPGDYPPCVQQLLDDLKRHENLPHHARWYLAVYLLHIGMPIEQIVSLYSNLPDFNEKITRYQIDHAKKKGYSLPTCSTIKSWGISCPNCNRVSPMQWRR